MTVLTILSAVAIFFLTAYLIVGISSLLRDSRLILWRLAKSRRDKEKISVSPEEKAKELLANLLTEEQKEELRQEGNVSEKGKYGVYTIWCQNPNRIRVAFNPPDICDMRMIPAELDPWGAGMVSKSRDICVSNMVKSGPWPDVAATLILYIRAGRELEIFEKGTWGNNV